MKNKMSNGKNNTVMKLVNGFRNIKDKKTGKRRRETLKEFKRRNKNRSYWYYSGKAQKTVADGGENSKKITYLDYITRPSAVFNSNISVLELDELLLSYKNGGLDYKKLLENFGGNENTGIWDKNGVVSIERKAEIEEELKNLDEEQHFWDSVLSFDNDFVEKYRIYHPELVRKAVADNMKILWETEGIKTDDIEWFFSMHKNTEHFHVHLGMFEKIPTFGSNYRQKFNFNKEQLEKFRFNITRSIILNREFFDVERNLNLTSEKVLKYFEYERNSKEFSDNPTWNEAKRVFNDMTGGYSQMLQEYNSSRYKFDNNFISKKNLNFQMLNKNQQNNMVNLIEKLVNFDSAIKKEYETYLEGLIIYQRATNEANGEYVDENGAPNKLSVGENDSYVKNRLYGDENSKGGGFYERIGNKLLKSMKNSNKITQNDFFPKHSRSVERIEISLFQQWRDWFLKDMKINNKILYDIKINNKNIRELKEKWNKVRNEGKNYAH